MQLRPFQTGIRLTMRLTGDGRIGTLLGFVSVAGCGPRGPGGWKSTERRARPLPRISRIVFDVDRFGFRMTWLRSPLLIIVGTQLLFTTGDLIARANMRHGPFALSTFLSWWFLSYFLIRQIAMFGQLYVFSALQIGKTMALFSATSIILVNILGVLLLGEVLSVRAYLAVGMVVLAFIILSISS